MNQTIIERHCCVCGSRFLSLNREQFNVEPMTCSISCASSPKASDCYGRVVRRQIGKTIDGLPIYHGKVEMSGFKAWHPKAKLYDIASAILKTEQLIS